MPQLDNLHSTLEKACNTLGMTVNEAFARIGASTPDVDEMAQMPVSTWVNLCTSLCLSPDHALYGYNESQHRHLIDRKKITSPTARGSGVCMNLLIVEDNPAILEMLDMVLKLEGYNVFLSSRPSVALEILKTQHIDGIVSDIRMPEMSGIELGKVLRGKGIKIPIVYLSAEADGANFYKNELLEIGNFMFVAKPSPTTDLLDALARILPKT